MLPSLLRLLDDYTCFRCPFDLVYGMYEGHSINKLQNGVIMSYFSNEKNPKYIHFAGNLIPSTS